MSVLEALVAFDVVNESLSGDKELHHLESEKILLKFMDSHSEACATVAKAFREAQNTVGGWWYA